MTDTERDAARWRYVREFLAIEDIEAWANMRGHQPIEEESAKADGAVDVLLIEREAMAEREADARQEEEDFARDRYRAFYP